MEIIPDCMRYTTDNIHPDFMDGHCQSHLLQWYYKKKKKKRSLDFCFVIDVCGRVCAVDDIKCTLTDGLHECMPPDGFILLQKLKPQSLAQSNIGSISYPLLLRSASHSYYTTPSSPHVQERTALLYPICTTQNIYSDSTFQYGPFTYETLTAMHEPTGHFSRLLAFRMSINSTLLHSALAIRTHSILPLFVDHIEIVCSFY